ncbi:hypothetical protein ACJJTC_018932 [Scirpophaga incertulas]
MNKQNNESDVLSCDPANARRHRTSRTRGEKYVTGHPTVYLQAVGGNNTTEILTMSNTARTKHTSLTKAPSLRRPMNIGTWNVRGLLKPGKLEILEREKERLNIDILGISETHWRESGHFDTDCGGTVFCSGAFVSPDTAQCVPRPLNLDAQNKNIQFVHENREWPP